MLSIQSIQFSFRKQCIFLQCNIDLKRNVLHIGTTGTETPFLPESDLPKCARLSGSSQEDLLNQSSKEFEDRQLKETRDKPKQGGSGKQK